MTLLVALIDDSAMKMPGLIHANRAVRRLRRWYEGSVSEQKSSMIIAEWLEHEIEIRKIKLHGKKIRALKSNS